MEDLKTGDKVLVGGVLVTFVNIVGRTLLSVTKAVVEEEGARYEVFLHDIKRRQ